MSGAFQKELEFLGAESSPAFVRAPEGNGCAERFIRTLKENLLWLRTFDTVEDLRQALLAFREAYNTTWLIERHGCITPQAFRQKQLQPAALAASASTRCLNNRGRYSGQCLDRRIGERQKLVSQIAAWQRQRNSARARIKWMFTTERARSKLAHAYPGPKIGRASCRERV